MPKIRLRVWPFPLIGLVMPYQPTPTTDVSAISMVLRRADRLWMASMPLHAIPDRNRLVFAAVNTLIVIVWPVVRSRGSGQPLTDAPNPRSVTRLPRRATEGSLQPACILYGPDQPHRGSIVIIDQAGMRTFISVMPWMKFE